MRQWAGESPTAISTANPADGVLHSDFIAATEAALLVDTASLDFAVGDTQPRGIGDDSDYLHGPITSGMATNVGPLIGVI